MAVQYNNRLWERTAMGLPAGCHSVGVNSRGLQTKSQSPLFPEAGGD